MSNNEEEELELDMGKRPSRQRRHLPTAVTSATTKKRQESNNYKNIPLLKMTFSNSPVESDSKQQEEEEEEEREVSSKTTGYTPRNSTMSSKRKKRVNNNNASELKKKTQQFIHNSVNDNHSKLKKIVIWLVVILWILFIFYRIVSSLKNDSAEHLSILYFIKR